MKFHDFRTGWEEMKKTGLAQSMGWQRMEDCIEYFLSLPQNDPITFRHGLFMRDWYALGRPYYNVYPCIVPPLSKINLEFPGHMVHKPSGLSSLVLRFPEDGSAKLCQNDLDVRTIFLSFQPCTSEIGGDRLVSGLVVGLDIGEEYEIAPNVTIPIHTMKIFPLDERSCQETVWALPAHSSIHLGVEVPKELLQRAINLAIAICMIDTDPDLLEPDYLNCDLSKVSPWNSAKLQQKAIRRGKFGFHLGRHMEVIPHFRRPHPALMWTGHGRTIPRIVFRKGSLIHRAAIEKIPTALENSYDHEKRQKE